MSTQDSFHKCWWNMRAISQVKAGWASRSWWRHRFWNLLAVTRTGGRNSVPVFEGAAWSFVGCVVLVPLTGEVCLPFVSAGPNLAVIYLMKYWTIVCRPHIDLFWGGSGAHVVWIFMGETKYAIPGIPATSGVINGWRNSRCCVPISSLVIYIKIFKMEIYFHSSRYIGHHILHDSSIAFLSHPFIHWHSPFQSYWQWQFRISC